MSGPKRPWDCDTTMSKPSLERIMRALIVCGGHFTDSLTLGGDALTTGRFLRVSLFLRVWLPEGQASRFEELAKPYERLRPPPRVSVRLDGWGCPECDQCCPQGHHGGAEWRERVRS